MTCTPKTLICSSSISSETYLFSGHNSCIRENFETYIWPTICSHEFASQALSLPRHAKQKLIASKFQGTLEPTVSLRTFYRRWRTTTAISSVSQTFTKLSVFSDYDQIARIFPNPRSHAWRSVKYLSSTYTQRQNT